MSETTNEELSGPPNRIADDVFGYRDLSKTEREIVIAHYQGEPLGGAEVYALLRKHLPDDAH